LQLASDLNITQKTAWFVLHRIREMLKANSPGMIGGNGAMVEADETYIGGRISNKHQDKVVRNADGSLALHKEVVLGIIERDGKVVLKHIDSAKAQNMVPFIERTVQVGTRVITDESNAYGGLSRNYAHNKVNHSLKVYVNGDAHTNTIENFWSVLKRGLYGIYHSVSEKHLERYLNEFSSRYNERKLSSQARFEGFLTQSQRRLRYKSLIS
jgi:transposase-like protein